MYTRDSLYCSLKQLVPKDALLGAIDYAQQKTGSVYSFATIMQTPLAYAFFLEYVPPQTVFREFDSDQCFKMYVRYLLDICLRSFERDSFPFNYEWSDFWDEKDELIFSKMRCLAREGQLKSFGSKPEEICFNADEEEARVHYFFQRSDLFRPMIFESLFNIYPHSGDWTLEWASKKMQDLLRKCGYSFYLMNRQQGVVNLKVRSDI